MFTGWKLLQKAPINICQFSSIEYFILRENFLKMLYSMIFLFCER